MVKRAIYQTQPGNETVFDFSHLVNLMGISENLNLSKVKKKNNSYYHFNFAVISNTENFTTGKPTPNSWCMLYLIHVLFPV